MKAEVNSMITKIPARQETLQSQEKLNLMAFHTEIEVKKQHQAKEECNFLKSKFVKSVENNKNRYVYLWGGKKTIFNRMKRLK